jgi:hypothetical protein
MTRTAEAQALIDSYAQEVNRGPLGEYGRPFAINIYTQAVDDAFKVFEKLRGRALDEALGLTRTSQKALEESGVFAPVAPPKVVPTKFTPSPIPPSADARPVPPSVSPQPEVVLMQEGHIIPLKYPQLPPGTLPKGPVRRYPTRSLPASAKMEDKVLPVDAHYTDDDELLFLGRVLNSRIRAYYHLKEGPAFELSGEWLYYHVLLGHLSMERLRGSRNARGEEMRRQFHLLSTHINLADFKKADGELPKVEE